MALSDLIKRAARQRFSAASTLLSGSFTIWIEHAGQEVSINAIGGRVMDSGKPMPGGNLMRMETRDVSVMVALSSLPNGYTLEEGKRFWASETGDRAVAKSYKIASWDSAAHLASHVEIKGLRGK